MKRFDNSKRILVLVGIMAVIGLAGCGEPASPSYSFRDVSHKQPAFNGPSYHVAGKSVQGRDIKYSVHGNGGEVVFIMGGIHGNEVSSVKIATKLEQVLAEKPYLAAGKTIVVLPVANPDGYAKRTRHNANNVDLNRNFATNNRINNNIYGDRGFTEPESRAIAGILKKYRPGWIVSLHSPLGCVDYDGYAAGLAFRMSRNCDLPVRKLGSRPGSLGSYAGLELGIPIVTFEATGDDDLLDGQRLWAKYGDAIMAAVNYRVYAK